MDTQPKNNTLWRPEFEKDSCGVGFIADVSGKPSHRILRMAIQGVCCVTHRGAVSADAKTGDGAGILTQIPRKLFARELARLNNGTKANPQDLGVGVFFLPQDPSNRTAAKGIADRIVREQGLLHYGWREVPVNPDVLGDKALTTMPAIQHLLVGKPTKKSVPGTRQQEPVPGAQAESEFERALYYTRRLIERAFAQARLEGAYIPSFSSRTIVYKGLLVAPQLNRFYEDLTDPSFETAIAVFHQRYSTNTFPNWILAQPFRYLGHNGEINTLLGNQNWMRAREPELRSPVWGDRIKDLFPVIQKGGSDSAMLDNALELLVASGIDLLHAMTILVPEAWQNMPGMDQKMKAFFEYLACLSEPWDGPAALAFTDGIVAAATLDRNGLRPARYKVTRDGLVVLGSEVGIVELDESQVIESGRLGPGQMLAVDTARKKLLRDDDIKRELSEHKPYAAWLHSHMLRPDLLHLNDGSPVVTYPKEGQSPAGTVPHEPLIRVMKASGFTQEDLQFMLKAMAETGKEAVGSMGDDAPLAILSTRPRILSTYFKQMFAQVTNPPIDPLRERLVMSLNTALGARGSMLEETPEHAKWIKFGSPVFSEPEMKWIEGLTDPAFRSVRLPVLFAASAGPAGLEKAIRQLCERASAAVDAGCTVLILTDRGMDAANAAIPIWMAAGAVHHSLIRQGKRMRASIVCETAQLWEMHHFALLIGYGTAAIHPYGATQAIAWAHASGTIKGVTLEQAWANYEKAIEDGILKIMSKMGISCVSSYRGAQIFEAIGLSDEVIETCFTGTISRIGGVGFELLAKDTLALHASAYQGLSPKGTVPIPVQLDPGGFYRFRRDGELHAFNPPVLDAIHTAVHSGNWADYQKYADLVNNREPVCLRDLLEFSSDRKPIPVEEVEPVEGIRKRFCTAGMSYGALSKETHECLGVAMNRIGGKSNSGEGGEDLARLKPFPNGDSACSAIKQVASGRFGVTPEYLASARELEIKMAQGSKPGEGGQLPGHKVSEDIARVRHSVPGVTLISPPPHHDIYSIEDLAQLIYDLKQANAKAKICVKLVAEAGVGTIAAGVAKGYADVVHIAGHDGGTGASPISSIKNAGSPWELGVAETQQILVMNDLRGRIVVRTDGGMKSGRDIAMAALFGAESFNFGTAALVGAGCCMVRQCHLNTCPVGVATQDPKLRLKFKSPPDLVVNFFTFVAEEVRQILAQLGYRSLDEVIGRIDLVKVKAKAKQHPKWATIDWSALLANPDPAGTRPRRCLVDRNDREGDQPLDEQILAEAKPALEGRGRVTLRFPVKNHQRSIGTRLSYEIATRYGDSGLPGGASIEIQLSGSAGQSFGAFLISGVRLALTGDSNDYVGKGMHGGEISVRANPRVPAHADHLVLVGNTVMYGATGGTLYVAGQAGERFCVRNSGGRAVVEGIGDHGCEYMTGGMVVILGPTGRNFGAGMTGGAAVVLDPEGNFPQRLNPALVELSRVDDSEDQSLLKSLIVRHAELTGSKKAEELLSDWDQALAAFWKVAPKKEVVKLEAAVGAPTQKA